MFTIYIHMQLDEQAHYVHAYAGRPSDKPTNSKVHTLLIAEAYEKVYIISYFGRITIYGCSVYMQTHAHKYRYKESPSCMRQTLIAFQKHDGHTYIHIHMVAYPWPTVRDPMPRTSM